LNISTKKIFTRGPDSGNGVGALTRKSTNFIQHNHPPKKVDISVNLKDFHMRQTCSKPHKTVGLLKRALVKAWDEEVTLKRLNKIVDD
jgi:hypothetical protein